jgi:uncharacterized membrane protein SirB2
MYAVLKHIHMLTLAISFLLFFIRGVLMMRNAAAASHRAFLIVPHINNLLLIGSGISLAVFLHLSPGTQPWILVKLIALAVYIGLGIATFKHPKMAYRKAFWLLALIVFAFIVSVAVTKNPLGFFQ